MFIPPSETSFINFVKFLAKKLTPITININAAVNIMIDEGNLSPEIKYDNNKVVKVINVPEFDSSKLSVVNDEMLIDTIDPSSFFLNVLDFNKTESCKNKFKIFDGKRRYDVVFNNLLRNKDDGTIECEATQIRLGGYKSDEKVKDVFAASDYIKVIYKDDKLNSFVGYEAKNGSIKIIINEAS